MHGLPPLEKWPFYLNRISLFGNARNGILWLFTFVAIGSIRYFTFSSPQIVSPF